MSEWRKVIQCCPDGHVAELAFHGPTDAAPQDASQGKRCSRCQGRLLAFTFQYENAQDAPSPGRWRVYMADGKPVAVANVAEVADGQINVTLARRRKDPRVDVGSRDWKEAMDLADQWADEALGHEPSPFTPWLRDRA